MPDLSAMLERGPVVCAEGYLFECERRGYLQAGAFVPEVVLDHPEVVEELHREFVHAGSDVVEAFTYYGHRQKLRVIGKEDILEPLNRQALSIAARVASETGTLLAGNLCNTNVYEPGTSAVGEAKAAFEEQVAWAAEAGADMIIAETFSWLGEALLALEAIQAAGLPAVVTFAVHREGTLRDEPSPAEACRQAEQAGAAVVGLNCIRGPRTMLPLLGQIREAVSCEVAALPVPYRTTEAEPSMQSLHDPGRGGA
ncbi:MAG TPA: homocysteine S-methyltransferase family protein, partial [Streptosporangiaceae bacterium]|nr:homocysteine S-methyltransferase family protein [Streptosporangiaceae bacterium]